MGIVWDSKLFEICLLAIYWDLRNMHLFRGIYCYGKRFDIALR